MALEKYLLPEENVLQFPLHSFVGILSEVLHGKKSEGDAKTAIETHLDVTLTDDEAQDLTDTLAYINLGSSESEKSSNANEIFRVCLLASTGIWYGTQALLKTRLGWA